MSDCDAAVAETATRVRPSRSGGRVFGGFLALIFAQSAAAGDAEGDQRAMTAGARGDPDVPSRIPRAGAQRRVLFLYNRFRTEEVKV